MKKTAIALVVVSTTLFTAVNAQANTYVGVGVSSLNFEENSTNFGSSTVAGLFLGYELHPNFALEGLVATSVTEAKYKESDPEFNFSATQKTSVNNAFGLYGVGKVNVVDSFEVYGKLGFTRVNIKIKYRGMDDFGSFSSSGSATETSVSYGVGANYFFSDTVGLRTEFMRYYDKDSVTISGFGGGVLVKF